MCEKKGHRVGIDSHGALICKILDAHSTVSIFSRKLILGHHDEESLYLQDVLLAMEQNFAENEYEARLDFQSTRDDVKNKVGVKRGEQTLWYFYICWWMGESDHNLEQTDESAGKKNLYPQVLAVVCMALNFFFSEVMTYWYGSHYLWKCSLFLECYGFIIIWELHFCYILVCWFKKEDASRKNLALFAVINPRHPIMVLNRSGVWYQTSLPTLATVFVVSCLLILKSIFFAGLFFLQCIVIIVKIH